jgi:multiple sugar transport system permease protein
VSQSGLRARSYDYGRVATRRAPGLSLWWRRNRRRLLRAALIYTGLGLLLAWTLLPLYWLLFVSVVNREELLNRPTHFIPHAPHLRQYLWLVQLQLFQPDGGLLSGTGPNDLVLLGWRNSLLLALLVVPLTLAVALPAAYALGRLRFRRKTGLLLVLVFSRSFPPMTILIPFAYLYMKLGLQGSLPALAAVHMTLTVPLVTWVMSGFFASLPQNLERAARIDGLTRWGALWHVLVPIARPGIAACAVIAFIITWNEFLFAMINTSGTNAQTAPLNVGTAGPAFIALSMLPCMALALVFQRRIRSLNIVNPL